MQPRTSQYWYVVLFVLMVFMPLSNQATEQQQLIFGGDVMLGRMIDEHIRQQGPASVWGQDVASLLKSADLSFVNLESVIAIGGEQFKPDRAYYFRAAPDAAQALSYAGIDFVSLANNHAMDFGAQGLAETLANLDKVGIAHAGAGMNRQQASAVTWLKTGDLKVAVISAADHFVEYAAEDNKAGINLIEVSTQSSDLKLIKIQIHEARSQGADLVVFSIHWGPNWREYPTPRFRKFARAVIDGGADIFHGHSAHLFQVAEVYKQRPILYGSGDLLDDYMYYPDKRNDLQLLFKVSLVDKKPSCLELIPVQIDQMQVKKASGSEARLVHERLQRLQAPLGTKLLPSNDHQLIELREKGCLGSGM